MLVLGHGACLLCRPLVPSAMTKVSTSCQPQPKLWFFPFPTSHWPLLPLSHKRWQKGLLLRLRDCNGSAGQDCSLASCLTCLLSRYYLSALSFGCKCMTASIACTAVTQSMQPCHCSLLVCCYMLETHWSDSQQHLETLTFKALQNISIII